MTAQPNPYADLAALAARMEHGPLRPVPQLPTDAAVVEPLAEPVLELMIGFGDLVRVVIELAALVAQLEASTSARLASLESANADRL